MSHPFFGEGPKPRIFGHRGFISHEHAAAGILENSRVAIHAALEAGADFVESDCQLTYDGRVVLFHDDTLARTLGDPRPVSSVTYAELAALMGERGGLLALDEALADFPQAKFNVDMKSEEVAEPGGDIVGRLAPDRVLIGSFADSFRTRSVAAAQAASATGQRPAAGAGQRTIVRILTAVAMRSAQLLDRAFADIDAVQIPVRHGPVRVLSPRLVREAHLRGVEVHVWTVNDPDRMRELAAARVDGIITDRTDRAVAEFRAPVGEAS